MPDTRPQERRRFDSDDAPGPLEEVPAWALPAFVLAVLALGALYRLLT